MLFTMQPDHQGVLQEAEQTLAAPQEHRRLELRAVELEGEQGCCL